MILVKELLIKAAADLLTIYSGNFDHSKICILVNVS